MSTAAAVATAAIFIAAIIPVEHAGGLDQGGCRSEVALMEKARVRDPSPALALPSSGFCLPVPALFPLYKGDRWLNMPPDSSSVSCGPASPSA